MFYFLVADTHIFSNSFKFFANLLIVYFTNFKSYNLSAIATEDFSSLFIFDAPKFCFFFSIHHCPYTERPTALPCTLWTYTSTHVAGDWLFRTQPRRSTDKLEMLCCTLNMWQVANTSVLPQNFQKFWLKVKLIFWFWKLKKRKRYGKSFEKLSKGGWLSPHVNC